MSKMMTRKTTTKTFDTKSYELALHFLEDEPKLDNVGNRVALAVAIQTAIEDWFLQHQYELTQ